MTFNEIASDLEKTLSKKRYTHTMGVVESAVMLAKRYGAPVEKARLAALLHDCAKELSLDEMRRLVADCDCDKEMLSSGALLHGPAGMVKAKERYHVADGEILEAIRVHTTGKVGMSLLDKIIFLADYIEPGRDFPGVEALRIQATQDLDQAVLMGYDATIRHLLDLGSSIYPLTILGRNDLIRCSK